MKIITRYARQKISAEPRSLQATSTSTCAAATSEVRTMSLNSVARLSIPAIASTKVIFTISDAWKVKPPIEIDIFAP